MLRGFATVNFFADDLIAARDWYADLFGTDAYFQRPDEENPAYVEFRVGDYEDELGIIDRRYAPHRHESPGGAVIYWHVDDLAATVKDLLGKGRQGARADRRARRWFHHGVGRRPVRQHPGHHGQPALHGDPRRALTVRTCETRPPPPLPSGRVRRVVVAGDFVHSWRTHGAQRVICGTADSQEVAMRAMRRQKANRHGLRQVMFPRRSSRG